MGYFSFERPVIYHAYIYVNLFFNFKSRYIPVSKTFFFAGNQSGPLCVCLCFEQFDLTSVFLCQKLRSHVKKNDSFPTKYYDPFCAQCISKRQFTQATINCLNTNKLNNDCLLEKHILSPIGYD